MSDDQSGTGTSVDTVKTQKRALKSLVSQEAGGVDSNETTLKGYHLFSALEKLIRLLILVTIWVRCSHKGKPILRINKEERQRAPQKPQWAKPPYSLREAAKEHARGVDSVTDEKGGSSLYETPDISLSALSWTDVAAKAVGWFWQISSFIINPQIVICSFNTFFFFKCREKKVNNKGNKLKSRKRDLDKRASG